MDVASTINRRKPIWAALFSLIFPGLGHVYSGYLIRGLCIYGLLIGIFVLLGLFGVLHTFYGIVFVLAFTVLVYGYSFVDSIRLASKNSDYQLKPFNRWYWYIIIVLAAWAVTTILTHDRVNVLGYATYSIPAQSMYPTLHVGDYITVDTKHDQPVVGDVVVFKYPKKPEQDYIKRVAGVSNDTLEIKDGIVIINGTPANKLTVPEADRQATYSTTMAPLQIPNNMFFVLGDNRDKSNDSRFWGFVPINNYVGKAAYIWLSRDKQRIGKQIK